MAAGLLFALHLLFLLHLRTGAFNAVRISSFAPTVQLKHVHAPRIRNTVGAYATRRSIETVNPSQSVLDFEFLTSLDDRCEKLSSLESEFMLSFWSDELQCFQIFPKASSSRRVSITTSCISLTAIMENPSHWQNIAAWAGASQRDKISLKNIVNAITNAPWSADTFQTQMLIQTLCAFADPEGVVQSPKFAEAVDILLERRAKLSLHRIQTTSAYLRHQNVRALLALVEHGFVPPQRQIEEISHALERANLVAFDEMCRQLAFFNSGDSAHYDVIVLAYSLLSYWDTSNSMSLTSFARGVVPAMNMKLVSAALAIIFQSQAEDGSWRKGEPINTAGDMTGRDIGNNYVFFFDMVGSLLGSIGEKEPQLLAPFLPNFER